MGHTHDHGHSHSAGHQGESDVHLIAAVCVNGALTVVQVIGGLASGSLSLLADALHNLSDAGALLIALFARRIGRRPADHAQTFGYRRAELVGAVINATTLNVVGLYLLYEAAYRLVNPTPVIGWTVIVVAGSDCQVRYTCRGWARAAAEKSAMTVNASPWARPIPQPRSRFMLTAICYPDWRHESAPPNLENRCPSPFVVAALSCQSGPC